MDDNNDINSFPYFNSIVSTGTYKVLLFSSINGGEISKPIMMVAVVEMVMF